MRDLDATAVGRLPGVLAGVAPEGETWSPPWQSLPVDLPRRLAPAVPGLVGRIIRIVPDQVPAYAAARDGRSGDKLRLGVYTAFEQLLRLPGTSLPALNTESRELMAALGAGEFREGRTMDSLLGAYRTAARIAFRDLSTECARQGLGMDVVVDLGESIWAYIDELSSVSAQAYAAEQSARAGVRELHRSGLATALVAGGSTETQVQRLATLSGWPVPRRIAVVVLPVASAEEARSRLGRAGVLADREDDVVALLDAGDSRGRRERLARTLQGLGAVVGPVVGWSQVPHAHDVARALLAPCDPDGVPGAAAWSPDPEDPPLFADDHLGRAVLGGQPRVLEALAARVLAPLADLSPAKRAVMEETLLAWLRHWGRRGEVADELALHPQTVGYRVGRLRELFGETLEDPEARFELELALRAATLWHPPAARRPAPPSVASPHAGASGAQQ